MSAADVEKRKTLEKWAFRGVCPSSFPKPLKNGPFVGSVPQVFCIDRMEFDANGDILPVVMAE